jgi:putative chitinase
MSIDAYGVVKKLAPNAKPNYLDAIKDGGALLREHGITTPLRMAHFLAQALHETNGFFYLRENMNYSAETLVKVFGVGHHSAKITPAEAAQLARKPEAIAERIYGLGNPRKAHELGNVQKGDAYKYRGNGVLQTTGRNNHRTIAHETGVDFEAHPELVTAPEHALKPALAHWTANDLNAAADKNDIKTITLRINGGLIGFDDRKRWFSLLWPLLKDDSHPAEASEAADPDSKVKWLQDALNRLGADPELTVDGRAGPATEKAVRDFQKLAGIPVDGVAGPVTEAAIKLRLDVVRAGHGDGEHPDG